MVHGSEGTTTQKYTFTHKLKKSLVKKNKIVEIKLKIIILFSCISLHKAKKQSWMNKRTKKVIEQTSSVQKEKKERQYLII